MAYNVINGVIDTEEELRECQALTNDFYIYSSWLEVVEGLRAAMNGFSSNFDIEAIADEAFAWYRAFDPETGAEHHNEQGYVQIVDEDELWDIAAKYDTDTDNDSGDAA